MSLGLLAVLGLLDGLGVDSMPWWRFCSYLVLCVLSYLHGRHVDGRYGWQILTAVAGAGVVITVVDQGEGLAALLNLGVMVVLPWLAGRYRRQQALLVLAGQERVRQLEREREHVEERARLQERGRLAADLHDSLGHELALIALRAGALELAPELAGEHRRAAGELRRSAVTATDRLRQSIGMLRDRGVVPFEALDDVVRRAQQAGMTVSMTRSELVEVPELVDRAVHRVVLEGLTNAARHAPGAPVTVVVEAAAHEVAVSLSNPVSNPVANQAPPAGSAGGSGLVGLRERVELLGGRLRADRSDGRFEVVARMPIA